MNRQRLFGLVAAASLAGCGGPASSGPVASVGPHQGRLVGLPDGLGFVEVLAANKADGGRKLTPEVVAYFLAADGQTPLQPAPTAVAVQVYLAEAKTLEKVALQPDAAAAEPARFAAAPPPGFDGTLRTGRINATVAGHAVDLPF